MTDKERIKSIEYKLKNFQPDISDVGTAEVNWQAVAIDQYWLIEKAKSAVELETELETAAKELLLTTAEASLQIGAWKEKTKSLFFENEEQAQLLHRYHLENVAMRKTLEYCRDQLVRGGTGSRNKLSAAVNEQLMELEVLHEPE